MEEKRLCPNCGAEFLAGQVFCTNCGQKVDVTPPVTPQTPPITDQPTAPQTPMDPPVAPQTPPIMDQPTAPQTPPVMNQPVTPQMPPIMDQPTAPQMPPVMNQPVTPQMPPVAPQFSMPPVAPAKKKSKAPLIIAIVAAVCVLALIAYFVFFSGTPVDRIELDQSTLTLTVGNSDTLGYEIFPQDATETELTWSSSNTSVATVSNGRVTAVSEGTCTITVTAKSSVLDTCEVTVEPLISEENAMIAGTWYVSVTYFDGEASPFYNDSVYLQLNEDLTGEMPLGDTNYTISSWDFTRMSDGNYLYDARMSELGNVNFIYSMDDPSSSLYGCLILVLDSDNMVIFER